MCIGLKYSANTRRLLVLARTHSALKNLPSITTNIYCELFVFLSAHCHDLDDICLDEDLEVGGIENGCASGIVNITSGHQVPGGRTVTKMNFTIFFASAATICIAIVIIPSVDDSVTLPCSNSIPFAAFITIQRPFPSKCRLNHRDQTKSQSSSGY